MCHGQQGKHSSSYSLVSSCKKKRQKIELNLFENQNNNYGQLRYSDGLCKKINYRNADLTTVLYPHSLQLYLVCPFCAVTLPHGAYIP